MNNEEYLIKDCKKDKELLNSYVNGLLFPGILLLLLLVIYYIDQKQ